MKMHMLQRERWRVGGGVGRGWGSGVVVGVGGFTGLRAPTVSPSLPVWLIAKSENAKADEKRLFEKNIFYIQAVNVSDGRRSRRSEGSLPLSHCLHLPLSGSATLCIIFTSLAFQEKKKITSLWLMRCRHWAESVITPVTKPGQHCAAHESSEKVCQKTFHVLRNPQTTNSRSLARSLTLSLSLRSLSLPPADGSEAGAQLQGGAWESRGFDVESWVFVNSRGRNVCHCSRRR